MTEELSFIVVTPHTIRKSRTGAIISRLLNRVNSELIATRLFATTKEMAEKYAATIRPGDCPEDEKHRALLRKYILENFSPNQDGRRHRSLLLVFRGENAYEETKKAVGNVLLSNESGETIRDTYGELIRTADGEVRYFEPAVIIPDTHELVAEDLRIWMEFADREPALLAQIPEYTHPERVQQTLVMIKPDNWRQRSSRPGAVIDMFSRTGLRMIGMKVNRMTINQALEFYGQVVGALRKKLAPGIGLKAREILERELKIQLPPGATRDLAKIIGVPFAEDQFEKIVEFMTGRKPTNVPVGERDDDGRVKSLVIIYEGEDAIEKIRDVLGPTDPTKAPGGTVRSEFGQNIMINTAHASDSPENAAREIDILDMHNSNFSNIIRRAMDEIGIADPTT